MRLNLCLCLQTAKEIHAVGDEVEDAIFLHGVVHNVVQHGADVIDGELHPPVDSIAQTVLHRTSHVAEIDPLADLLEALGFPQSVVVLRLVLVELQDRPSVFLHRDAGLHIRLEALLTLPQVLAHGVGDALLVALLAPGQLHAVRIHC